MLSRVAERLYWFARYIERTENTARLLLVHHHLILDLPKSIQPDWDYIIDVLGARAEFDSRKIKPTEQNVTRFAFGDHNNSSSIFSSVKFARENVRTTREVIPSETWEHVNSLYHSLAHRANKNLPRSERHKVLNNIIGSCQKIVGVLAGTMNQDEAYHFIRIGRNIERADMSTRIVDAGTISLGGDSDEIQPYRNVLWISILHSLSAYQMYRLNVRRNVVPAEVLNFLLRSTVFPRAAAHNLQILDECVRQLPAHKKPLQAIRQIFAELEAANLSEMKREDLHYFIDELQLQLSEIHQQIGAAWFYRNTPS
jgi:uncharacterized alpha-E superfamily protein